MYFPGARLYRIPLAFTAVTVQVDLVEINVASTGIVLVCSGKLAQSTDYGDAAAEGLQLTWITGHATSGSGGSSVTPVASGADSAFAGTVEAFNTTIASTGSPVTIKADGWNIQAGFEFHYSPLELLFLPSSARAVLRMSAPADSITVGGYVDIIEAK